MNTELKKLQVAEESVKLDRTLNELAESIAALRDRLQVILRSDFDEVKDGELADQQVPLPIDQLVPLADEIRGHCGCAKSMLNQINRLIDSIEL